MWQIYCILFFSPLLISESWSGTHFQCNICFLCIIISSVKCASWFLAEQTKQTPKVSKCFQLSWMPLLSIRPSLTSTSQRNIPHKQPTLGDLISPEGGDGDLPFIPSVLYRAMAITVLRGSVSSTQLWEYFPPWQSLCKEIKKYEVLLISPISHRYGEEEKEGSHKLLICYGHSDTRIAEVLCSPLV